MADGDKKTSQVWALRDNNIGESSPQLVAGNPATLEDQEILDIFFNYGTLWQFISNGLNVLLQSCVGLCSHVNFQ